MRQTCTSKEYVIAFKAEALGERRFHGLAVPRGVMDTDGDIIDPEGAWYELPIPLLVEHEIGRAAGVIDRVEVTDEGLEIWGKIPKVDAPARLKSAIETIYNKMKHGLLNGLSVRIKARMDDVDPVSGGRYRFRKWYMPEVSLTTVPIVPGAGILAVKSQAAFGRQSQPGASGSIHTGVDMKTLHEQLREQQEARDGFRARLEEILQVTKSENREMGADEEAEYGEMVDAVKAADRKIKSLEGELIVAENASTVSKSSRYSGGMSGGGGRRAPDIFVPKEDPDDKFIGQSFARIQLAKAQGFIQGRPPPQVAHERWGRRYPKLVEKVKADVEGGGTGSGEWFSELADSDTKYMGDFIKYLHGITAFDQLGLYQVPARVHIKGVDGASTAYWVGESAAKPVSAMSASDVELLPKKIAGVCVLSDELVMSSDPNAELLARNELGEAIRSAVDTKFFSTDAVTATSPAGILNGVSGKTSAGTSADNLREDVGDLYAEFDAINLLDDTDEGRLVFATTPILAKRIGLMRSSLGIYEFPEMRGREKYLEGDRLYTSSKVSSGDLILMSPRNIWRIGDLGLQTSVSREASIEMSDAPTMDSQAPTGPTGKVVSMFQTDSVAIRVVRYVNWQLRRSGVVQYIDNGNYGNATS